MTFASRSGEFANVTFVGGPSYQVQYNSTDVTLVAAGGSTYLPLVMRSFIAGW